MDPGTVSVSALAGEGGSSSGEGGLSSTTSGWLSASAFSTCTSGSVLVAGTWGEEGEDSQSVGERSQVQGPWGSSKKPQKGCSEQPHLPEGPTAELPECPPQDGPQPAGSVCLGEPATGQMLPHPRVRP